MATATSDQSAVGADPRRAPDAWQEPGGPQLARDAARGALGSRRAFSAGPAAQPPARSNHESSVGARPPSRLGRRAERAARGLGWVSIGLGMAGLLAPRAMARVLGLPAGGVLMLQLVGLREIASGIGLLNTRDPQPWVWGRVAGDAMDVAALSTQLGRGHPQRVNAGVALAAVAGIALADVACANALDHERARRVRPQFDYSDRSGFPAPAVEMRGVALQDFDAPADMRAPPALRPFGLA